MNRWKACTAILLLALTAACASSSGGGEGDESEFEEQLGRVLYPPLRDALDRILPKYQLAVRRQEEQYSSLYYETEWKDRTVTPEEQEQGIVAARDRAIIRGRRVGQTMDGVGEFRVTMTAEYQARAEMDDAWRPAPAPPSFFEQWRSVYSDLRLEVQTGVRR